MCEFALGVGEGRFVRLYNPVDKATIASARLNTTDRERIVLPDAKFEQSVADNRRHIHDSSVGERAHHLIAKASLDFQSICIGHVAVTRTLRVPTSPAWGVPLNVRVVELKLSHDGRALPLLRVAL